MSHGWVNTTYWNWGYCIKCTAVTTPVKGVRGRNQAEKLAFRIPRYEAVLSWSNLPPFVRLDSCFCITDLSRTWLTAWWRRSRSACNRRLFIFWSFANLVFVVVLFLPLFCLAVFRCGWRSGTRSRNEMKPSCSGAILLSAVCLHGFAPGRPR